jgi:hypothetical protein
MHGGWTDIILGFFGDGWKFANENTSIKHMWCIVDESKGPVFST